MNQLIEKKQAQIVNNFRNTNFQRPSDILKVAYTTNEKNKTNSLVNVIKSGLNDLKNEIENMSEEENKLKNQMRQQILLKEFLRLTI